MENKVQKRKIWKGKWVTNAVYNKRLKQVENGKKRQKEVKSEDVPSFPVKGCRIIDLEYLVKSLECRFCKKPLNLSNIEKENLKGLASIFKIRCGECLILNDIPTGKSHEDVTGHSRKFDINSKAALGGLHTGFGHTHIEKFLRVVDVPAFSSKTFKAHEREIGKLVENTAKESCERAAKLERSLTIENANELSKMLPEETGQNFFTVGKEPSTLQEDDIVRIAGSVDMGYSGRGNGFTYDSPNGYSALIGVQTGLVIDYKTTNRICRFCSTGHSKDDHDCRLNFYGSAKAMEAHAAVKLTTQSSLLKKANVEVGVLVADNDASTESAVLEAADHSIIKLSDKNHTSKGVKNMLYKINKNQDPGKELTAESITYLHRCFSYAVAQNQNNIPALKSAIKNIPYHVFNIHDNCGYWCGFVQDPNTYEHKTILGGLKNPILFKTLTIEFDKLAGNAQKFASEASTQSNESLNSIMARKAPKSTCYSVSESCDFRYGCSVLQKNDGDSYLSRTIEKASMPIGNCLKELIDRNERITQKRKIITKTPQFKRVRRERKKHRSQLRFRNEANEIDTYESHMGLLSCESDKENQSPMNTLDAIRNITSVMYSIVYFDLETSGFSMTADILQIAMKSDGRIFNQYVTPTQQIGVHASESNGLTNCGTDLFYHGRQVRTSLISVVLYKLMQFLQDLEKPCILIAHNCKFDAPRLMRAIKNHQLIDQYRAIINCFQDTLPLFKKKFPERKSKNQLKLTSLASETLSLSTKHAHNADYDVYLLEQLVEHHLCTSDVIETGTKSFDIVLQDLINYENAEKIIPTLHPLQQVVSNNMIKRLASFCLSYEIITKTFKDCGREKTILLLQQQKKGKPQAIKCKKIIASILNHLENHPSDKM